jgi:hypothetical protein
VLSSRAAFEPAEELVGAGEPDGAAAADYDVPERGGGQVGLADPDRPENTGAAGIVEESQRAQLVPELAVEPDTGVGGEGLQPHGGVELGGAGAQLGRGAVAAVDLVGEHELQELRVRELLGAGQREPFGQGVEAPAELDGAAGS